MFLCDFPNGGGEGLTCVLRKMVESFKVEVTSISRVWVRLLPVSRVSALDTTSISKTFSEDIVKSWAEDDECAKRKIFSIKWTFLETKICLVFKSYTL